MDKLANFLGIIKKSGNLIYGPDKIKKKNAKNKVKSVIIASDLSENSLKKLNSLNFKGMQKIRLTREEIERATGKFTGTLGILDEAMAKELSKLIQQEETGI